MKKFLNFIIDYEILPIVSTLALIVIFIWAATIIIQETNDFKKYQNFYKNHQVITTK